MQLWAGGAERVSWRAPNPLAAAGGMGHQGHAGDSLGDAGAEAAGAADPTAVFVSIRRPGSEAVPVKPASRGHPLGVEVHRGLAQQ